MLKFARASSGYLIIETTMSATRDYVKTVHYTKDLDKKCINTGPWQETTEADRVWFEKHYRDKFEDSVAKCPCCDSPLYTYGCYECTNNSCTFRCNTNDLHKITAAMLAYKFTVKP
jgi:hypothetical protein